MLNYMITILNIKVSNADEEKDLQIQMMVAMDFIRSKFGTLTIPEVQEAFKMYVAKEFPDIKVFRILDCVAIGEVLSSYKNFRNENLRIYSQKKTSLLNAPKQTTEQDKINIREAFLKSVFSDLKESKYSSDGWLLFDELEKSGKLKISIDDKNRSYEYELKKYMNELEAALIKNPHSMANKNNLQNAKNVIANGKRLTTVRNKCRSIAVSDFLIRHMETFEEFKAVFSE